MNIYGKLLNIQAALKAPKSQFNKFGNYPYRNCEDILEAVKPLALQEKVALVVGDELVLIGERYYIKATATLYDCESSESVSNSAYARESDSKKGMDESQVTGSTSSYARKYALNGLFDIDDTKDADFHNTGDKSNQQENKQSQNKGNKPAINQKAAESKSAEQIAAEEQTKIAAQKIDQNKINVIKKELERTGVAESAICKRYKVEKIQDLTEGVFSSLIKSLELTKDKEVNANATN